MSVHRFCAKHRTPLFPYVTRVSQMPGRHPKGHVYSTHCGTRLRSMLLATVPAKHMTVPSKPMRVNPVVASVRLETLHQAW
jgi:hypothetical protein